MSIEVMKMATEKLLELEPERDATFPFIVHHPIFESDVAMCGGEWLCVFDDAERAREPYRDIIASAESAARLLAIVRDPYKMLWFSLVAPCIGDAEEYADLLKHCWISEEWPSRDVNVPLDEVVGLFGGVDREFMGVGGLPESMVVYRGVNRGGSPCGLSWSLDREKAEWFAKRFGAGNAPELYSMSISRDEALAYITERGEEEVVVDARGMEGRMERLRLP